MVVMLGNELNNEQLANMWKSNPDKKHIQDFCIKELYRKNHGYFHKYALRVKDVRMNYEDYFGHAYPHIVEALKGFDPTLGYKFFTFSVWRLKSALTTFNENHTTLVKPKTTGGQTRYWEEESLNEANREGFEPINSIPAQRNEPPEDVKSYSNAVLGFLTKKERFIVCKYYGIGYGAPKILRQIAEEVGITHERVRQIKARALKKIRAQVNFETLIDTPIFKEMKQLYT